MGVAVVPLVVVVVVELPVDFPVDDPDTGPLHRRAGDDRPGGDAAVDRIPPEVVVGGGDSVGEDGGEDPCQQHDWDARVGGVDDVVGGAADMNGDTGGVDGADDVHVVGDGCC